MKTLSSRMSSATGLFALSLMAGTSLAQCPFTSIALRAATSTWTQQCDGRWTPAGVIDTNPGTGWAIGNCYAPGDRTMGQAIVFEAVPTPSLIASSRVRVRIHSGGFHSCCGGGNMTLGAFRLSVTADAQHEFANGAAVNGMVDADWYTLIPTSMAASPADPWGKPVAGANPALSLLDDDVILASGANPTCAWYTIEADLPIENITGIRIEVIDFNGSSLAAENGLPTGGPGRHNNGNMLIRQMTVEAAPGDPVISKQPFDTNICNDGTGSVSVVSSTPGASFQWRLNGVAVPGATSATLTLTNAMEAQDGMYDCVVSTACGSVTSTAARVNVCRPEFNCDGFLDFFDYADFVEAFETGQPRADYNRDGFIDMFDYMWFVDDFEIGC